MSNALPKVKCTPNIKIVTNNISTESETVILQNCYKLIANWVKKDLIKRKTGYN